MRHRPIPKEKLEHICPFGDVVACLCFSLWFVSFLFLLSSFLVPGLYGSMLSFDAPNKKPRRRRKEKKTMSFSSCFLRRRKTKCFLFEGP